MAPHDEANHRAKPLARALGSSALESSGVNIVAFLGFPAGGGQSKIDLVPEDPESLGAVAEQAGVTLSEAKRAFLIPVAPDDYERAAAALGA